LSRHLDLGGMCHHLPQVERLIDDVVVNDMGRAECQPQRLKVGILTLEVITRTFSLRCEPDNLTAGD